MLALVVAIQGAGSGIWGRLESSPGFVISIDVQLKIRGSPGRRRRGDVHRGPAWLSGKAARPQSRADGAAEASDAQQQRGDLPLTTCNLLLCLKRVTHPSAGTLS